MHNPDDENALYSPEYFCERVAAHMGLPDEEYKRITYTRFSEVFPDDEVLEDKIRIDFDGGRPEFHLHALPLELTENASRAIGHGFVALLKRAVKCLEDGTYTKITRPIMM